jgi:hypothetical protein
MVASARWNWTGQAISGLDELRKHLKDTHSKKFDLLARWIRMESGIQEEDVGHSSSRRAGERRDSITLTLPEGGKSRVGFGRREGSSQV